MREIQMEVMLLIIVATLLLLTLIKILVGGKIIMSRNRVQLIIRRWLGILLYAVIADVVLATGWTYQQWQSTALTPKPEPGTLQHIIAFAAEHSVIYAICSGIILLAVWRILYQLKIWRWGRPFTTQLAYPPLTYAITSGLAGITGYALLLTSSPVIKISAALLSILVPIVGTSVWALLHASWAWSVCLIEKVPPKARHRPPPEEVETHESSTNTWSKRELEDWLATETPVTEKFTHTLEVETLFDLYASNQPKRSQRVGLCGPYGSGKSSLLKSLERRLDEKNWITVFIDAWGRDASTIDQQLLALIIEALAKEVDVFRFAGLPQDYHAALKTAGPLIESVTAFSGNKNAAAHLKSIEDLLIALNINLLIAIEDPDRDTNCAEMILKIASLIDRVKPNEFSHIHFVIAYGHDAAKQTDIISRICEHRIDVPPFYSGELIGALLEKAWNPRSVEHNIIIPYGSVNRVAEVDAFLTTPRLLKQVCRRIDQAWQEEKLLGEIYLADLIILCALEEMGPAEFLEIINPYRKFCEIFRHENGIECTENEARHDAHKEYETAKAAVLNAEKYPKTVAVFKALFERDSISCPFPLEPWMFEIPQRAFTPSPAHTPVDYLERFIQKRPLGTAKSDQEKFRRMREFMELIAESKDICDKKLDYARLLLSDDQTSSWFKYLSYHPPFNTASLDITTTRIFKAIESCIEKSERISLHNNFFKRVLKSRFSPPSDYQFELMLKLIPTNLSLAEALIDDSIYLSKNHTNLVQAREKFLALLQEPENLSRQLESRNPKHYYIPNVMDRLKSSMLENRNETTDAQAHIYETKEFINRCILQIADNYLNASAPAVAETMLRILIAILEKFQPMEQEVQTKVRQCEIKSQMAHPALGQKLHEAAARYDNNTEQSAISPP